MKHLLVALALAATFVAAPADAAGRLKDSVRKPAVAVKRVVPKPAAKPARKAPVRKAPVRKAGTLGALKKR